MFSFVFVFVNLIHLTLLTRYETFKFDEQSGEGCSNIDPSGHNV